VVNFFDIDSYLGLRAYADQISVIIILFLSVFNAFYTFFVFFERSLR